MKLGDHVQQAMFSRQLDAVSVNKEQIGNRLWRGYEIT